MLTVQHPETKGRVMRLGDRLKHMGWLAAAWLAIASQAQAAPATYRYDPVHSQIVFSVDHNGYSRPFGRLHIAQGVLNFDPDNWPASTTELDIDLAGVDMGDPEWNKAVRAASLLDTDHAARAHFVSTSVERKGDNEGELRGNFTLRGVTRPVTINFRLNRLAKTIYGLHTVAGFSGNLTLNRTDFGMKENTGSIGLSVSVWLELEAIREGAEDNGPGAKNPPVMETKNATAQ
jgi:polyisoprenoid-binding protein YceI